jgi:hypothetical protein
LRAAGGRQAVSFDSLARSVEFNVHFFFFLESIDEDDELMMMTCLLVMQRDGRTVGEREREERSQAKSKRT